MPEQHTIVGGRVYVYKRPNPRLWQCSSYFAGKNRRTSTKEESLSKAKEIAEDWYLQLRGKLRAVRSRAKRPFARCLSSISTNTTSSRRDNATNDMWTASTGDRGLTWSPSSGTWESQRSLQERFKNTEFKDTKKQLPNAVSHLAAAPASGNRHPAPDPKTALRHGWLDRLPDFSEPYQSSPKISHRAWFSPEEYKKLYEATRKRAQEPNKKGFNWEAKQLHHFVLFAVNTGLRPGRGMAP
jgi:hypothetical protein